MTPTGMDPVRIAVDAMGGDDAPGVVVEGARLALADDDGVVVQLFGPEDTVRAALQEAGIEPSDRLRVVDAPDVVSMSDAPTVALKQKPNSSLHRGLGAVRDGASDAFASAGNTGAVMAVSLFLLGRLPGISRPSVIGLYPTVKGVTVLLDVGTNIDCRPEHLLQFGRMGSVYAERVLGVDGPRVGLLNVGEEPGKGNEVTREAHELLAGASDLNFAGNIEGRDLMQHAADVVVCDGFVGNVLLKFGESINGVLPHMVGAAMARLKTPPAGQQLVAEILGAVKERFSYERHGGMPLLGVRGTVLIGHGGSTALAVKNMILGAATMERRGVAPAIEAAFA